MNTSIPINASPNDKTISFASGKCDVDIWRANDLVKNFSFRTDKICVTGHFWYDLNLNMWYLTAATLDLQGDGQGLLKINAKNFFDAVVEWNKYEYRNSKNILINDKDDSSIFWTRNKEQKTTLFHILNDASMTITTILTLSENEIKDICSAINEAYLFLNASELIKLNKKPITTNINF